MYTMELPMYIISDYIHHYKLYCYGLGIGLGLDTVVIR